MKNPISSFIRYHTNVTIQDFSCKIAIKLAKIGIINAVMVRFLHHVSGACFCEHSRRLSP